MGGSDSYDDCLNISKEVKAQLEKLGFLLAQEKCIWLPTQSIKWLGYIWNTDIGKLFVSDERIDKTVAKIKVVLQKVSTGKILIYVRTLASIVGQLISMYLVFGNIVRFHTRYMYYCIMGKASWDAPVKLTQFVLNELFFLGEKLQNFK